jgi:predicted small lipoprotein YifL
MTTLSTVFRTLAITAMAVTLAACGTTPPVAPPTPSLQDMLTQASQASASGNKEKAVTLWKQTATTYPADKTPWVNITQTRYDAGQYGEAIVSAQEILVRDPSNTFANSIIATAGLRLSTQALGNLSRQNNLNGTVKSESQELAKVLRENLGESTLFTSNVGKPPVVEREYKKPVPTRRPAKPEADTKADPFSALK